MPGTSLTTAYAECAALVRREDPDRWFASLFWPATARPHAHALIAFSLEIARVRESVSEPMLGEIRHQWWREAIEKREPGGNPLAEALIDTIARFNLDAGRLVALIEARAFDLYDDPMPTEAALEGYLRDTSGALFEAIARVLAAGRLPPRCTDAAGRAYALMNLLRGLPWQVMRGQLFIPLDLLARHALGSHDVLAHRNSPALARVLQALRERVRDHLAAMRASLPAENPSASGQPSAGVGACLPAFLCEPFLERMEAPGLDPFETPIELPRWRRQWTLFRAARRL